MGKGSRRRPTDERKFAENWEKIFRKKEGGTVAPGSGREEQDVHGEELEPVHDVGTVGYKTGGGFSWHDPI